MPEFADWPPAAKAAAGVVGLVLLALLWSLLASTVFLLGTRLLAPGTLPLLQFWSYLRWYGFAHPVVGGWLQVAAVVATAVPLLLLLARLVRLGGPRHDRRPLHGATRWANHRELARAGFHATFGGLYVGRDGWGRHLRFGGPEHVACYAPTRSGKGVGLVIPNCLLYEASLVVFDMKREAWRATAGIRAEAGQRVFLFDPLAPDGRTARYNPFGYVRRGTLDAFEDVQRVAQMVFPHVEGEGQFWADSARSAFTGAAGFLAETPELPLTFGEVLRLLSSVDGAAAMLERIEARRRAGAPYTEATVKSLEDYLKGSADLVNSIRKTATARLSLWFNPRVDAATSASDFDLRQLRSSLHAVYVGVSPDNLARLQPLLALFFQQLVDLSTRTLPRFDPTARHQVLLLLDEFPALGRMPVLANAVPTVADFGLRLLLILQSPAQLRDHELYGPEKAEAILDNCGLEVVFGTKNQKLAEELSDRLGYATVTATSRSGAAHGRAWRRDRESVTESEQRRALLLPQEITRLRPQEAILLRPGLFPVRCRRIRYFRERTFTRLLRPPPDVPAIDVPVRLDQGKGFAPIAAEGEAAADGRAAAAPAPEPELAPHQADGLLTAILGAQLDLGDGNLADTRAALARAITAVPTRALRHQQGRTPG